VTNVNYYDRERLSAGDNPTLGLILCTDRNDAVVKYTLGDDTRRKISVSRYKLLVPTEAELKQANPPRVEVAGSIDEAKKAEKDNSRANFVRSPRLPMPLYSPRG
jgi:hypothetical protein